MKKIYFTFLLLMLFNGLLLDAVSPSLVLSQVNQDWVARYIAPGNNYNDIPYNVAVDAAGNVYVFGTSFANGISGNDYCTIKYNSAGVQQWIQRYNGPGNGSDVGAAMVIDGSANVYVTGYRFNGGAASNYDFCTIKYNSAGVQQWIATYNGPDNSADGATAIAIDGSGNVYVTGYSFGNATGNDYATVKYNSAGVQLWADRYDGTGHLHDLTSSIGIDPSGNVYVTGWSMKTSFASTEDYATIKYNSSGVQQWVQRYDGIENNQDKATSLAVDDSGNVYITGYSWGGGINYATIKYNTAGIQKWVTLYDGGSTDKAAALKIDVSGNIYVTGWSYGLGEDYATVKYNNAGVQQWVSRYDGGQSGTVLTDFAKYLAIDTAGNVYVTGESWGGTATNYDYATIKYNAAGAQQWVQRYTRTGYFIDYGNAISVDLSGNVYVSGVSEGNLVTIKYSQPIGIQQISNTIPEDFSFLQNYPNPFNPVTNIEFSIPKSSFVKLVVYDMTGKEVEILVNQFMTPGTFKADWNASNYTSGVYFYRLDSKDFSQTKKMVLIK